MGQLSIQILMYKHIRQHGSNTTRVKRLWAILHDFDNDIKQYAN